MQSIKLSQSENILERLKINKDISPIKYNYHPNNFDELRSLLEKLIEERGQDANLNDIDVSKITSFGDYIKNGKYRDYYGVFYGLDPHNIKIDRWDVSNVENMDFTFDNCINFNCDLSNWNVRNVNRMKYMFNGCMSFTGQGLENWKPIKCKFMILMFEGSGVKKYPDWYKE